MTVSILSNPSLILLFYEVKHHIIMTRLKLTSNFKRRRKPEARRLHTHLQISWSHCLLLLVGYICVSTLIFSLVFRRPPPRTTNTELDTTNYHTDWTLIDCCYFAIVTVSTVGYGDFYPATNVQRLVVCLYVLTGASLVAIALGLLGSNMGEIVHQGGGNNANNNQEEQTKRQDSDTSSSGSKNKELGRRIQENILWINEEIQKAWYSKRYIVENMVVGFLICVLGYLIGRDQGWDVPATIYFGIMTGKKKKELDYKVYFPRSC